MSSSTDLEHASPDRLGCKLSFAFSGKSVKNRFLKSSTSECMASFSETDIDRCGIPFAELVNLYRHWGKGSIGHIITGNIMINCAHLVCTACGLRFDRFSGIALEAKRHGSLVIAQLCHPGRQTPLHLQAFPISTGDVGIRGGDFGTDFGKPRPATKISTVLLRNSLMPRHSYGGNMKNRMGLISEFRESISERVAKDFIVGIKINAVEFQESTFGSEEADQLSIELEQRCFDFVELSDGTYEDWTMHHRHIASHAKLYSKRMRQTRIYVTGGLRSIRGMVRALDGVDGIGLARPLCQESHLCSYLLSGRVTSASAIKINMDDFHLTSVAALIQMSKACSLLIWVLSKM
ncbi:hypothetical protein BDV26DRAFT_285756 [Aspergillus bertholletiae]|uniref:NADH:flavin oxidoreductase/NADH oxidase N-terminal domain-containing protein n=1 Tax=Aspergillus bertholletiae TaxID=1226010 RepID=A0A5N7ATQ0_9EURO|nr:hypothetical protein BDV26DRAFT_285756 [Aspergillus bertholletiae]